jgi:hypothetical protein
MKKFKKFCGYVFVIGVILLLWQLTMDFLFGEFSRKNLMIIGLMVAGSLIPSLLINLIIGRKRKISRELLFHRLNWKEKKL